VRGGSAALKTADCKHTQRAAAQWEIQCDLGSAALGFDGAKLPREADKDREREREYTARKAGMS